MKTPRLIGLFVFVLLVHFNGWANAEFNRDSTSFSVGAKVQMGTILFHKFELGGVAKSSPVLFELDLGWTKNTKAAWDNCNCYTKNGISLMYSNFGNPNELGKAISLVFYVEPHLIKKNRTALSFRAGAGPSYMNKVHDDQTNPNNFFYSMPLSYLLTIGTNLSYSISTHTHVNLAFQFNHISNGGTRIPNYGINYPTAGVGFQYKFSPQRLVPRKRAPLQRKDLELLVHLFSGPRIAKAYDPIPVERRLITGINISLVKRLSKINALGLGGEFYYDPISKVYEERSGDVYQTKIASLGIHHYLFFGKAFFGQQIARYVTAHNPDIDTNWYQRYFVGYRISNLWFIGVSLKTHLEVADFATLTAGFSL